MLGACVRRRITSLWVSHASKCHFERWEGSGDISKSGRRRGFRRKRGLIRGGQDIPCDEGSDCRNLEEVVENVGKGRIGTEHRVVYCGMESCGNGWIACQAVPTKRHGPPKVRLPKPTSIQNPSPYRHNSLAQILHILLNPPISPDIANPQAIS